MRISQIIIAITAVFSVTAHATNSINLSSYIVSGTYGLDLTVGSVSGLEASAVTYAKDRNSLFFVGDEGTGVIETTLTGQALGSMAFNWAGTASTNHDTEGITYIGGGQLVVAEERLYDAYSFSFLSNGNATLANSFVSISNAVVGNNGLEGISYDARDGSFVSIKQQSPQDILAGSLTFAGGAGGTSTMSNLFNPTLLSVTTLSDVQVLSSIDYISGTAAADNLLVLSLGSKKLLEVNRTGQVMSFLDLAGILPHNAIEGVTVDQNGTIYLVAEQIQDGSNIGIDPFPKSQLIVLTAPVPEPETYAMLIAGLGLMGAVKRRTNRST
jgi:uncharacterized protein YjiK